MQGRLQVKAISKLFDAKYVVSTLPPNLFCNRIRVTPELPDRLRAIAKITHTWMAESIKVSLIFESAFWRQKELSGTIFSNVGPIPEMYDHSNYEDSRYALKGFLNGVYFNLSLEERKSLVLNQLRKYYGNKVDDHLAYEEKVWRNETYSYVPYDDHVLPHQNNGHDVFQQSFLDGSLFIAGTETSPIYPGYMEGAVRSAQLCFQKLTKQFNSW